MRLQNKISNEPHVKDAKPARAREEAVA